MMTVRVTISVARQSLATATSQRAHAALSCVLCTARLHTLLTASQHLAELYEGPRRCNASMTVAADFAGRPQAGPGPPL
jgi:hypothetical protein